MEMLVAAHSAGLMHPDAYQLTANTGNCMGCEMEIMRSQVVS